MALFFVNTASVQFRIPLKIKYAPATWVITKLLNGLMKIRILMNISRIAYTSSKDQLDSPIVFNLKDKSIFTTAK